MVAIPILSGYLAKSTADFVQSYPVNYEPVFADTGLSKGYLKSPPGIANFGTGPGLDRGGIEWNGVLYRVMGSKLIKVNNAGLHQVLGDVGNDGKPVSLDYSFDRLSIGSRKKLFYYNEDLGLVRVIDPDLGDVLDHIFVDGYFMSTDGEFLVVTELDDPMAVDPLKYGSSETDPDPVNGLILIRSEVYACNRNTINVFYNAGTTGFPFALNKGATIPKGPVGTNASCRYGIGGLAFVGSGRDEALGIYLVNGGQVAKISTRTIDDLLLIEADPENIICETITRNDEQRLLVHISDRTLVFSGIADNLPVWHERRSGADMTGEYRGRFFTLAYDKWVCGDVGSNKLGYLDDTISTDFGEVCGRRFDTFLIYNEGRGGIVHSLELVGLPGRAPLSESPVVFFSCTRDGQTWSEERAVSSGSFGQMQRRVQARPHWRMRNYIGFRLRSADDASAGWARLEAQIEPLGV